MSLLGKNKIDVLQEKMYMYFERCIDTRKQYEEEMKQTYVFGKINL